MKSQSLLIPVISQLLLPLTDICATQLDGLWRSDREQISLRIETTADGFKAKRQDQGIWYFYQHQNDQYYADQAGNYYEILEEDILLWRDANANKKILFKRLSFRDDPERKDFDRNDDNRNDPDNYDDNDRYGDNRNHSTSASINGTWFSQGHKREIIVETGRHGLRIRKADGRWILFEQTTNRGVYRNNHGDAIILINHNTLQWKSREKGYSITFHRYGSRKP